MDWAAWETWQDWFLLQEQAFRSAWDVRNFFPRWQDGSECDHVSDSLNVKKRTVTGTKRMRRMRAAGEIPAVLYGHGQESIALTLSAREVERTIAHGGHMVELKGDLDENALVKEIQWDAFGSEVLHVDLNRVDANEAVEVSVTLEFRGDAPGVGEGGIVRHLEHEITILCPANRIPDQLEVRLHDLHLDGSIVLSEIAIPEAAELVTPPDTVLAVCELPVVVEEQAADDEAAEGAAEPEVIKKGADDDEESDD